MHVGLLLIFQNFQGRQNDAEMVRDQMHLAELAEPLGYDAVWPPEHHFTDYSACPDNIQFLSWLAGRTKKLKLAMVGTAITVYVNGSPVIAVNDSSIRTTGYPGIFNQGGIHNGILLDNYLVTGVGSGTLQPPATPAAQRSRRSATAAMSTSSSSSRRAASRRSSNVR